MSENVRKGPSKVVIILLIVIIVLVIGGGVVLTIVLLNRNGDDDGGVEPAKTIGYQNEGVVILNEDDWNNLNIPSPAEGMIDLNYKNIAESTDGVNFVCEINNAIGNKYDMYFNIYSDDTFEEQLLLTGLVPPGGGLESFKSEVPLENGIYEAVLVMTQVDDDHATIVGQVNVVLTLFVYDPNE